MSPQFSIAHYRIVSKLGEGGMGAVYRATDTKLNRDVAIKVLPPMFAEDGARMARFEREAQVLASLNHPNIAAIHGLEQNAIVMELVEGEDLRGPAPLDTVISFARQIAAGLEAAHEKGIVHRDLKPANIKVTADGVVKLLDFGLAKASEATASAAATHSPTVSLAMTQAGVILGTAAYMAPEQARGQAVDKRADIWAFGAVLYELLTGKQLFEGPTVSDTLAAVLRQEIDFSAVPMRFRRLLRACLERDPRLRLRDIGDMRLMLNEPEPAPAAVVQKPRWPYFAAAACAFAAVLAGAGWWRTGPSVERPLLHMSVDLGPNAAPAAPASFAISPDGRRLVYHEGHSLAVRELNHPTGTVLTGTTGAAQPFFSPDGQWIAFFADGKLKKMPVSGGAAVPLCDASSARGGSWGKDGRIVFSPDGRGELFVIGENGGAARPLTKRQAGELAHRWPQWLPGNDAVLFSANSLQTNWENAEVIAWRVSTGQRQVLVRGGFYGRYVPGGYLLYAREGKLFGLRFDPSRLEVSGQPVVLADNLAASEQSGGGQFDFAENGLLVYLAGKGDTARYAFGWMAAGDKVQLLTGAPPDSYLDPLLSPDGKRLAMILPGGTVAIWDFGREAMTRLPAATGAGTHAAWMPDGRHFISTTPDSLVYRRADGSGEPVTLLQVGDQVSTYSMSADGRFLAYGKGGLVRGEVWILPIDAADPDHPKVGTPELFQKKASYAMFSPDGRWLAYVSGEAGNLEVCVRPFRGDGKWSISAGGGTHPKWSKAGRQLFYATTNVADQKVMVVNYTITGDTFSPAKPRLWSDTPINAASGRPNFDIAPDGKRILAFPSDEAPKGNMHVTLIVNFLEELKRRIP